MKKKIALVGLYYDNNLGDPLMVECVENLYTKIAQESGEEVEFTYIDLFGRKSQEEFYDYQSPTYLNRSLVFSTRVIGKIFRNFSVTLDSYVQDQRFKLDINLKKRLESYYKALLNDVDLVVIVGGALVKFRLIRDFHNPIHTLVSVASSLNKTVFFNAVGIENGYDLRYHGCKIVKSYLNNNCVKLISTRDDIDTLYKYVEKNNVKTQKSSDTAIWVDEIFNVEPYYNSNIVGIGVIDPIRFEQYEQKITAVEYEKWVEQLLWLLTERNIEWKLFTNGHIDDYEFAKKLASKAQGGYDRLVERPTHYKQLIETINSFGVVLASRLHACIIAYGLDKQIIGVDWNDKVIFFGNDINSSETFLKPHEIQPEEVCQLIINGFKKTYDQDERFKYRQSVKNTLKESLTLIK